MAFGREWDNERELAIKNNGDAEKMLEIYIFNHMKKKNLHDTAKFFAKEANIETPQLIEIKENLLMEWWEVFWPIFCSSLSNEVKRKYKEHRIFGMSDFLYKPCSSNHVLRFLLIKVNIMTKEKYMFHENERDAEEMLHLYIYHYMKERELHEVAKIFDEEAKFEMFRILDYDEILLKDWWDVFWPRFFSRMTGKPEGHPQSSAQPSIGEAQEMLSSFKRSQQLPTENPSEHVGNVMGHPPEVMSQAPQEMSQRRAGKRPMNIDNSSILGHSASKEKGKGPLGFPPVKLLPSEITPVKHPENLSHLQMPGTIQPPSQVVGAYRSVQLESTFPAEQDSVYPPVTLNAGESSRKDQGLLSGIRVYEPDGPVHDSFKSQVPHAFSEFMQQEAEEWKQISNLSLDKS